jgi:hypothetical protein
VSLWGPDEPSRALVIFSGVSGCLLFQLLEFFVSILNNSAVGVVGHLLESYLHGLALALESLKVYRGQLFVSLNQQNQAVGYYDLDVGHLVA